MDPNVVAWLIVMFSGGCFVAWLLYKLYEHDYKKANKENNSDYWS
jgi:hypothetical protein